MMKGNTTINNLSGKSQSGRLVATKLQIDLIVEVDDALLHLPKFPFPSRSGRLNKLVFEFLDTENDHIKLAAGFPGGAESFALAAKFFCGSDVTPGITASNVAALRCAAEYLEMKEDLEEGNLISKTEAFLSDILISSWLDCITVLQSCSGLSPWAENLNIEQRCVDSIAWKVATDPARIKWAYTPLTKKADTLMSPIKHHSIVPNKKRIRMQTNRGEGESSRERPTQLPDTALEIQKLRAEFTTLEKFCKTMLKQLEKYCTEKMNISPSCALPLPWKYLMWKPRDSEQKAGHFLPSMLNELPVQTDGNHAMASTRADNVGMSKIIKLRRKSI